MEAHATSASRVRARPPATRSAERAQRLERRLQGPLLAATLLVVPVLVIQSSRVGPAVATLADVLDWAIWAAFALEVVLMLAVAPSRRGWLRHHPLEVAIVVLTPPFLPATLAGARLLRLLRVLWILRLTGLSRRMFSLDGLRYSGVVVAVAAIAGGAAFAASEQISTWKGIYWAVSTMTTVGYGDIVPHHTLSYVVAVVLMLLGVGFAGIFVGAVAQQFLSPGARQRDGDGPPSSQPDGDTAVLAEIDAISERVDQLRSRLHARS